jgi:hypothetical protein
LNPSNSFLLLVPFPAAGVFEPVEASKVCIKGFCIYLTVEIASLRSVRPEAPWVRMAQGHRARSMNYRRQCV